MSESSKTWPLFQADLPQVRVRYTLLLQDIIDLLRQELGEDLVSVYLLGSPGRGCATLFKANDTWEIANDLDLAVVLKQRVGAASWLKLAEACTHLVNPSSVYVRNAFSELDFHVDLFQFAQKELDALSPTLFAADFAYGGLLLNGREARSVVRFDLASIPILEAYLLLYNRLCSMIETVQADYFTIGCGPKSTGWNTTFYFAKKGIVDSGAAVLIARGDYSPDYMERARRLRSLSSERADRYEWWIREGALIEPAALTGQALTAAWREGYDSWQFARAQIGLPSLRESNGQVSWQAVRRWWIAAIQSEYSLRRWGRGNRLAKVLKGTARLCYSVPSFWQRLETYASAEQLADEWHTMLDEDIPTGPELTGWYARRRVTIHRWKRFNRK